MVWTFKSDTEAEVTAVQVITTASGSPPFLALCIQHRHMAPSLFLFDGGDGFIEWLNGISALRTQWLWMHKIHGDPGIDVGGSVKFALTLLGVFLLTAVFLHYGVLTFTLAHRVGFLLSQSQHVAFWCWNGVTLLGSCAVKSVNIWMLCLTFWEMLSVEELDERIEKWSLQEVTVPF